MGVNRMAGTPFHIEVQRRKQGDPRRHKAKCLYYEDGFCGNVKCIGSTHCKDYVDKTLLKQENEVKTKSTDFDKVIAAYNLDKKKTISKYIKNDLQVKKSFLCIKLSDVQSIEYLCAVETREGYKFEVTIDFFDEFKEFPLTNIYIDIDGVFYHTKALNPKSDLKRIDDKIHISTYLYHWFKKQLDESKIVNKYDVDINICETAFVVDVIDKY